VNQSEFKIRAAWFGGRDIKLKMGGGSRPFR
jgi:hypothetical protein